MLILSEHTEECNKHFSMSPFDLATSQHITFHLYFHCVCMNLGIYAPTILYCPAYTINFLISPLML